MASMVLVFEAPDLSTHMHLAQQRKPDFEEVAGICVIAVGGWEAL